MKRIYALSLVMRTDAPEGPGWYIAGTAETENTGANIAPRRITPMQAEEISRAFEAIIPPGEEIIIHPFQIVREGTSEVRIAVKEELEAAEAAATRVAPLRKSLGELGEP